MERRPRRVKLDVWTPSVLLRADGNSSSCGAVMPAEMSSGWSDQHFLRPIDMEKWIGVKAQTLFVSTCAEG